MARRNNGQRRTSQRLYGSKRRWRLDGLVRDWAVPNGILQPTEADPFTFAGQDGQPWGPGWTFTQGTGDINANRGRMVTGTGGFDGRSAYYTHGTVDADVRIDLEIPTNDAQFPEVRARFSTANFDYVRLLFEPHNDTVFLHSYDNDVQQVQLATGSFAVTAGDIAHIRIVSVGNDTKVRLWLNGASEPGTWNLEGTTAFGATNTSLMVRTVTSNLGVAITNYWDNFAVTAGSFGGGSNSVNQSDTGSGVDAQSSTVTRTQTDTGSGADAQTSAVARTQTETGSGADNQTITVPISNSDTGSGADAESVVIVTAVSQSDTGSGADAQTGAAATAQTDVGAGADAQSSAVARTQTDTGAGADNQTVGVPVSQSDTGSGADAQTSAVARTQTDTGSGADAQSSAVARTQTETGAGADAQTLAVASTQADTGAGSETQVRTQLLSVASTSTAGPSGFEDTTLSVTKPSGVVSGDTVVIVVVGHNFSNSAHGFSISGFASRSANSSDGYTAVEIFDKLAGGSEPGTYTVNITNGAYTSAFAYRISGSAVFDAQASADSAGAFDGAHNIPSATATATNTLAIAGHTNWTDALSASPGGWTQLGPVDTVGYSFHRTFAASGATGSTTLTPLDTDRWASAVVLYRNEIVTPVSQSDTGAGVENQTSTVVRTVTESAVGADNWTLSVARTQTDTGAGTSETQQVSVPKSSSDTATAVDNQVAVELIRGIVSSDEARGYDLWWIRYVQEMTRLAAYTGSKAVEGEVRKPETSLISRARSRRRG